jgi:hypothetical protein
MKRILSSSLALSLGWAPVLIILPPLKPVFGQTQSPQIGALQQLIKQAGEQTQQGKPQQAIETLQQVINLARQMNEKEFEALALVGIGMNLGNTGHPDQAGLFHSYLGRDMLAS